MENRLSAPLGGLSYCAKTVRTWCLRITRWSAPKPAALSDHIARDIGLSQAEADRLRHEWPSQTYRHPYL